MIPEALLAVTLALSGTPGGKIVFTSSRAADGNSDIYLMNADGSGVRRLTSDPISDEAPSLSPDGNHVAFWRFHSKGGSLDSDLWVVGSDGSGERRLTSGGRARAPDWSPDGKRLVFTIETANSERIFLMSAAGGPRKLVTTGSVPDWAPDGQHLTFARGGNIWVTTLDGKSQKRLTVGLGVEWDPAWSHDGKRIAFDSDRDTGEVDPTPELWVMNADGSGQRRLTRNTKQDIQPTWSPDDRWLAFTSDRDAFDHIFVVHSDGNGTKRLTATRPKYSPGDYAPDWGL